MNRSTLYLSLLVLCFSCKLVRAGECWNQSYCGYYQKCCAQNSDQSNTVCYDQQCPGGWSELR